MRMLMGVLNLLLSLELILGPGISGLMSSSHAAESATTCPPGLSFDTNLNRCLTTQQTAEVMNAVSSCTATDVACYKANAENALSSKEAKGEVKAQIANKGFVSTVMNAAAIAVPVTIGVGAMSSLKSTCASFSYKAMIAGAAALFVGDNLANFMHKNRLKKIEGDWKKIINEKAEEETDKDKQKVYATEAQSQAFEMLARSEDSLASAAKMKSAFYAVAAGAFAASTAAAVLEILAAKTNPASFAKSMCASASTETQNPTDKPLDSIKDDSLKSNEIKDAFVNPVYKERQKYNIFQAKDVAALIVLSGEGEYPFSSPSIDEYENLQKIIPHEAKSSNFLSFMKEVSLMVMNNMLPIPRAHAEGLGTNVLAAGVAAAAGMALAKTELAVKMRTPEGRAITSGVFAGWSLVMLKHGLSQASASKNRASALRKMKSEFNDASGTLNICTAEDRTNVSKSECYCYTAEGTRNTARTNSTTCQNLWASKNGDETNYWGPGASKVSGCINSSNQYDASCACKAKASGCLKVDTSGIAKLNLGTFKMLASSVAPIGQIGTGTFDSANVNSAGLGSNAMRVLSAADKLSQQKGMEGLNSKKDKLASDLEKNLIAAGAGVPSPMLGHSSPPPMTPAQAVASLEKELKEEGGTDVKTANTPQGTMGQPGSPEPQLDFGLSSSDMAVQETQLAEAMKQDLDYGQNDINKGSTTNLFEVLSNRYQRSGLRRLFDAEGKASVDQPAKTDISK